MFVSRGTTLVIWVSKFSVPCTLPFLPRSAAQTRHLIWQMFPYYLAISHRRGAQSTPRLTILSVVRAPSSKDLTRFWSPSVTGISLMETISSYFLKIKKIMFISHFTFLLVTKYTIVLEFASMEKKKKRLATFSHCALCLSWGTQHHLSRRKEGTVS